MGSMMGCSLLELISFKTLPKCDCCDFCHLSLFDPVLCCSQIFKDQVSRRSS